MYCSIFSDFSHGVRTYVWNLVELCLPWVFNKTLSLVQYTCDCLQQFYFWSHLFINACLHCLINCQLASYLIFRIESLSNTNCDSVCCVVVRTVDPMANILDERTPSQGFLWIKSISCILNKTNSLIYSFYNCIGLWVSYTDEATRYSVVICHHRFELY